MILLNAISGQNSLVTAAGKSFLPTQKSMETKSNFIREDHKCEDVDFIRSLEIRRLDQLVFQNNTERAIRLHIRTLHIGGR